jgi:hypothetical protein
MSDQRLIDTIKHKLSIGVPNEEIIETLVDLGWDEVEVENALHTLTFGSKGPEPTPQVAQVKVAPVITPPKQPEPEPMGPKIVFTDIREGVPAEKKEKKGGGKSQIVLIALIIMITLAGTSAFIFMDEIKKIDPSQISIEKIIALFTGETKEPEPPKVEIPPITVGKVEGPYVLGAQLAMSKSNYAFFFEDGTYQYINVNGSSYGPYQKYTGKGGSKQITPSVYEDKFGFSYYDERQQAWYANINNNVKGPYSEISNVYYSASGYIFAGKNKEEIYYYININGTEDKKNPYVSIDNNVYLSDKGAYAFSYDSNGKKNINMNGKVFGPYNTIGSGVMYRDDKFYFLYSENGKDYVNINGKAYESTGSVVINQPKNEFAFYYTKEDGKEYVNINGKEVLNEEAIAMKTNYFFKNGSQYYVNIGDKKEGPYKNVVGLKKDGNSYIYAYQLDDGQWLVNVNGKGNGPYENVYPIMYIQGTSYGYLFQQGGKWNLNVNK